MDIAIVGPDPAAAALRSAFGDVDANVMSVDAELLDGFDFAAVAATTGDDVFRAASRALERWVAVEVGGVGGRGITDLDAAVTVFGPDSGCYDCLCDRVASNATGEADAPTGSRSAVRFAGALAGRRAIRFLTGEELAGTIAEVPGGTRRFLRSPGCECGTSPSGFDLVARDVELDDALDRAEQAVDPRVGLVREVGEQESFPIPYYLAALADTSPFSDVRCSEYGAGVAPGWDEAFMRALGEALERYAAGVYRTGRFRSAPTATLDNAVRVERFVRPDDRPSPGAEEAIAWVRGAQLRPAEEGPTADQPVWLPAEVVQFPPPTTRFVPPITTGLGLGNTTVEAVLSGLYETIERDATMLAWYSTFEPLGLSVEHDRYETLRGRARAERLEATALLVTQDVDVPVVAAAVHREEGWPRFAAGSAADLDPAMAAADALGEALQNWIELRGMGPEQAAKEEGAIGRYADFPDPVRSFVDPDATVGADSVASDVTGLSGARELETVLRRVKAADLDVYASRLTPRDLDALGFEAVRVLIPEAQPLFTDTPCFGSRIESVPESMGFEPRRNRPFHPYP